MVTFESDYTTGCHPSILKALEQTNMVQCSGYGSDFFCSNASEKIKKECKAPDADVEFISGGTQANQIVISSILKQYEGVISARTGHVNAHEAGAIEYTGHKVIEVPQYLGKVKAQDIRKLLENYFADPSFEHIVRPGMVYISQPTEYGTLYSLKELEELHSLCKEYNIPLYMDGARLVYTLTDFSLADIAERTDIFYIGGTKAGLLCGEAIVFNKGFRPEHFLSYKKQHGALLAKGRLLGIQFDTLFADNLFMEIAKSTKEKTLRLRSIIEKHGIDYFLDSPTNQQFVMMEKNKALLLSKNIGVSIWDNSGDDWVLRLACSWSTTDQDLEMLDKVLTSVEKENAG